MLDNERRPAIAIAALGIIVLGTIVLLGTHIWNGRQKTIVRSQAHGHDVAHIAAEQTARIIQAIDTTFLNVIDARHYGGIDWDDGRRVHDVLREQLRRNAHLRNLFIVDAHGKVARSLRSFPVPPSDVSDRTYFTAHRDDPDLGLAISLPIISRLDGTWTIFLSRRLNNSSGNFDGVIVASVKIATLRSVFDGVNLGKNAEILVLLESGALLLRSPDDDDAAIYNGFAGAAMLAKATRSTKVKHDDVIFTGKSDFDGICRVYVLQRASNMPVYVIVGIAEDEILGPWFQEFAVFLFMAAAIIAATGGLAVSILLNIVRREALLRALRNSEARFRDFAEAASDRFWETDVSHRLVWHNGLGDTPPPYVGKARWENLEIDLAEDEHWARLKDDMDMHRPFRGFQYSRVRDGQQLHRIVSGKPFFDTDGTFRGYRGTYADITDQIDSQERLRLHQERFLRSIESLSEGFALYDADDRLIVCNKRFQELYAPVVSCFAPGTSFESLLHACLALGMIPEAKDREAEWIAQQMAGHRNPPTIREVQLNGRWLQIREQRDTEGGTMILILDIHDQKTMELQQQALADRLHCLFEHMPAGCILVDSAFRVVDWNPTAERIFGFSKAEMLDVSPYETIIPRSARDDVETFIEKTYRETAAISGSGPNITKDGREIICEWFNTPLFDAAGQRCGMVSMVLDVTAKREAEEKLRQTTRMEAIGQLTGGIAHDFNNLLQVIIGNSEILVEALSDMPKLRRWAEMTKAAADRGADLTLRLLAYSRRQTLQPTSVDLNASIIEMRQLLERTLSRNVTIALELADNLWPAHVDAGQVDYALLNLALNSRDAMPEGGLLTIETANVSLTAEDTGDELSPGDYIRLSVRDTGTGMAADIAARAFEPFFTTKEVGKGSGLGLSMVHGFVTQSGGLVRLISSPGSGTIIRLYFPRAPQAARSIADNKKSPHPVAGGDRTILVVEDNDLVRTYASTQLAALGYQVIEAANGHDALHRLEENHGIDLLFTDMIMPGMNGRQVAEAATRLHPDIKVLFTTGYDEDAICSDALPFSGMLLKKPYHLQDLAQKVREALEPSALS